MKRSDFLFFLIIVLSFSILACNKRTKENRYNGKIRPLKDTVGFAQYSWQMDTIMKRITRDGWKPDNGLPLKLAVCPHDDYTYVGSLYPELLQNIHANTLILIGVAHKAAQMKIENNLVFDSYKCWKGPWKEVPVSSAREEIYAELKDKYAILNDTLQKVEHSLEAMIPYLQYFNRNIKIIPILVPAMSPERMQECGKALSEAIAKVAARRKWEWGNDFAIVVTTDAVHYGDEDWGGKNFAFYGCDDSGNRKAVEHEYEIIDSSLTGELTPGKIRKFSSYTLNDPDYREYKWSWCGRYSIPVALFASYYLNDTKPLTGILSGYSTSITSKHIMVDDISMGRTAIATNCHWVGYAAIAYR